MLSLIADADSFNTNVYYDNLDVIVSIIKDHELSNDLTQRVSIINDNEFH